MDELRLRSFGKINLSLKIIGIREDQFHELDSIMQSVSLFDEVLVSKNPSTIEVYCDDPLIPSGDQNTAYNAARAFFSFTKAPGGARIDIKKSIPSAAGLAGGSGNAAAALIGLDKLFQTKLSPGQLSLIGATVGSDVPFCLIGGRCRVRGRGEVVEPLVDLQRTWIVLVVPNVSVSTKWAYEEYDRWRMKKGLGARGQGLGGKAEGPMHNDLEAPISAKHPEISKAKESLILAGALGTSMSGSGPSVFGMTKSEEDAHQIGAKLKKSYQKVFVVHTEGQGVRII